MKITKLLTFFLIIIALGLISIYYPESIGQTVKSDYELEQAILLRVIDGDTIEVNSTNGLEKIRLLGINTPEKKMPFSNESNQFLSKFMGKNIELLRDWEDTDKYNRKLRYIFYEDRFINLEILENGLANAYYYSGLKYEKELLNAESQARRLGLGIWTPSRENCASCIALKEINPKEEFFIIKNNCNFNCDLSGWVVKDAGRNIISLESINLSEEKEYYSGQGKDIWNDKGDKLFLFDNKGLLVLYFEY